MVTKTKKLDIKISAKLREIKGNKMESLRRQGLLPAVIYGYKTKNIPVTLNFKEFFQAYKQAGESSLIDLSIEGQKAQMPVLIYNLQTEPLTGDIIHVDLYKPNLESKVQASVPLQIEGMAPAVKNFGGTLVRHFYELEVEALPMDLPHEITVNVDILKELGEEIYIKDIPVPEGVKILHNAEEGVVTVAAPERVEEELEKPIEEKLEEVETVGAKKEEDEEEGEEEKGEKTQGKPSGH